MNKMWGGKKDTKVAGRRRSDIDHKGANQYVEPNEITNRINYDEIKGMKMRCDIARTDQKPTDHTETNRHMMTHLQHPASSFSLPCCCSISKVGCVILILGILSLPLFAWCGEGKGDRCDRT